MAEAEKRALAWAERGLPVVIANPPCPIGAEDERPTPTGRMILDFLQQNFPALSRTGLNFISVRDLAEGLWATYEHGKIGERYLIGNRNLWLQEFIELLSFQTQLPAPKFTAPWPLIALAGIAGEIGGFFRKNNEGRICWETADYARRVQFLDLSKSRNELGWTPKIPIEKATTEAIYWFWEHSNFKFAPNSSSNLKTISLP